MAAITTEIEVASSYSADVVFKVFSDFDKIAPKADPQTFKSLEFLEGDGGVGSIRAVTFADGVPYKGGKQKVEIVDPSNFSYSYTFFEGDVLMGICDSITNHIKFVPSADGGCVYKHTIIFNCKGDAKPTEEVLNLVSESYKKTFKNVEAYAVANNLYN